MVCSELCKHGLGFVLVSVLVLIALAWPQALLLGPLSALESSRSICRVSNRVSVFVVSKYDKHIRANIGLYTYIHTDRYRYSYSYSYSCICICLWAQPAYAWHIRIHINTYISQQVEGPLMGLVLSEGH